jgi:isopentenyldiphosphate isomerase
MVSKRRVDRELETRVVHIFVVNRHNELLLQQLSARHDRHPLWWGAAVAGCVAKGESFAEANARKLAGELGITKRPKLVGRTQMRDGQSTKLIAVYALRWDGPLSPNPSDFAALEFRSLKQILARPASLKRRLTPTFRHIVQHLRGPLELFLES